MLPALLGPLFAIGIILVLEQRRWTHPFVTLLLCATAVGLAAHLSFAYTIRSVTEGFATAVLSTGLVLIAGSIGGAVLDRSALGSPPAGILPGRKRGIRLPAFLAVCGFVGGLSPAAEFVFILLMPWVRALARRYRQPLAANALALTLACVASNAVLVPAPGPVAAATILSADLWQTAVLGSIVAVGAGLAGWAFSLGVGRRRSRIATEQLPNGPALGPDHPRHRWGTIAVVAAPLPILVPMLLLLASSIGHMPSEPLGGGTTRELLLALGQPMTLVLASTAVAFVWRCPPLALPEKGWPESALTRVAGLVLTVGAVGAFARVVQNVGLGEILAEQLLPIPIGILLPFCMAMVIRVVYGSMMLATIIAAGLMQPVVAQAGLDSDTGRALCAVAIGAGAMVTPHVNDSLFWVFTRLVGLSTVEGLRLLTLGAAVQGAVAAAILTVMASLLL